jgi:hypothetical protein
MKLLWPLFVFVFVLLACENETSQTEGTSDPEQAVTLDTTSVPKTDTTNLLAEQPQRAIPALERKNGVVQLNWKVLGIMDFYEDYSEELEEYIPFPIFNDTLKAIEGELVSIEGYVIPVEETGDETLIVLSAFPYTQCFFCGNAGPESVMDIQLKKSAGRLSQDDVVRFRGRLKLNDSDFYYLNYILEDAERVR